MTKEEKEKEKAMYESYLLDEGAIGYILRMSKESLEDQLKEAKKYCDIPAKNAEDLQNQLRDENFLSIERISPWEFSSIPVLDYTGETHDFGCCRAYFGLVNKWGYKQPYCGFQIIYSSDFFVSWFGHIMTGGAPMFWVSVNNTVYRIMYSHKKLMLSSNIGVQPEPAAGLEQASLDAVVKKYYKCLRRYDPNFKWLEHEAGYQAMELDQHFPKGFFYKGPKWNHAEYRKVNYYAWDTDPGKKNISEIRGVKAENGLFKIEIENQTYPHTGYAYLDLAKLEIVRTEWVTL